MDLTAKVAADNFRKATHEGVVNQFRLECDRAIMKRSQEARAFVYVPAEHNHSIIQEVKKDLKSRGFEVEEQYQCNVGPFLFISWAYMLKD